MAVPNPIENPSSGGGGAGGVVTAHELVQFGRSAVVPDASGVLQLFAPGDTLQGFRVLRDGTITGLSLKTNVGDAVRSFELQARVNGAITTAILPFPGGGGDEQSINTLSVPVVVGDVVSVFLVRTAGTGDSSFNEEEALLEISESLTVGTGPSSTRTNRTVTTTGPLLVSDQVVFANAAGGAISLSLPNPLLYALLTITVKKIDATANAVTITPFAAETIDGATSLALTVQYQSVDLYCDGTDWHVV